MCVAASSASSLICRQITVWAPVDSNGPCQVNASISAVRTPDTGCRDDADRTSDLHASGRHGTSLRPPGAPCSPARSRTRHVSRRLALSSASTAAGFKPCAHGQALFPAPIKIHCGWVGGWEAANFAGFASTHRMLTHLPQARCSPTTMSCGRARQRGRRCRPGGTRSGTGSSLGCWNRQSPTVRKAG